MLYKREINNEIYLINIETMEEESSTEFPHMGMSAKVSVLSTAGDNITTVISGSKEGILIPFTVNGDFIFSVVLLSTEFPLHDVDATHTIFVNKSSIPMVSIPSESSLIAINQTGYELMMTPINDCPMTVIPDTSIDDSCKVSIDGIVTIPKDGVLQMLMHYRPHDRNVSGLYRLLSSGTDLMEYTTLELGDIIMVGYQVGEETMVKCYTRVSDNIATKALPKEVADV